MLPKIITDNLTPIVLKDEDVAFLKQSMEGCRVGGSISLPSGTVIDAPPPGRCWYITDGRIENHEQ